MRRTLTKVLAQVLSSWRPSSRLCILTFHRVLPELDPLRPFEPSAATFDALLAALKASFHILRLDAAVQAMERDELPPRALAITFDDGYRDNHDIALPLLSKHGVPATFFIATGYLGGGAMFNDVVIEAIRATPRRELAADWLDGKSVGFDSMAARRQAIDYVLPIIKKLPLDERNARVQEFCRALQVEPARDLMMDPEQVTALHRAGMEIGAHTVRHPILMSLPPEEAREEIATSKQVLEAQLGTEVVGFAYPNGRPGRDYDSSVHPEQARAAGFDYAVSTRWATADRAAPRFELARVAPWAPTPDGYLLRTALTYRYA